MNKMELFQERVYYEIDYTEFEKLVRESYSFDDDFDFVASIDCDNDTLHPFICVQHDELDDYARKDLQEFISGSSHTTYWDVDAIFNDLCDKGIIVPGNYLVHVCW